MSTSSTLSRTGVARKGTALLLLAASALAAATATTPALADVKAGVDAWSAGDYTGAIAQWRPLADRGDPDAQFNLAQAYKLGRGVPVDLVRAEDLYGKAAAGGHPQAADAYGLLLFQRGERERALPYLEASAARGDSRAQYILGIAHFNGDIVARDWVRAYALVSLAQQDGLPQATSAKVQMDKHIPLEERQKSVPLAAQIAAETQTNRQRLNTSATLGTQLATAQPAVAQPAAAAASTDSPSSAGADYTRSPSAPPPPVQTPPVQAPLRTAAVAGTESPASAGADFTRSASISPPPPVQTPAPTRTAARSEPKPTPRQGPKPSPKPKAASGPWRAQLGAFGVTGNAEALWSRVRGRPELAGHSRALVPAGKLTKLQATGFASRADAEAACHRLAAGGFGCLPVRD